MPNLHRLCKRAAPVLLLLSPLLAGMLSYAGPARSDSVTTATPSEVSRAHFSMLDVFALEWAEDPQIAPDGAHVVDRSSGFAITTDRRRGDLWILDMQSGRQRKLTSSQSDESLPRWSPDGSRIAFLAQAVDDNGSEIFVHWLATGQQARLTRLPETPGAISWNPAGTQLSFEMLVKAAPPTLAVRPTKPDAAQWAEPPRVTDRMYHERDGSGYIDPGFTHVFIVPAEGGSARQLSHGDFHHRQPAWSADGLSLLISEERVLGGLMRAALSACSAMDALRIRAPAPNFPPRWPWLP